MLYGIFAGRLSYGVDGQPIVFVTQEISSDQTTRITNTVTYAYVGRGAARLCFECPTLGIHNDNDL